MHREQNGIKGIIWTGIETFGEGKELREERRGGSTTIIFKDLKRCCMKEGLGLFYVILENRYSTKLDGD